MAEKTMHGMSFVLSRKTSSRILEEINQLPASHTLSKTKRRLQIQRGGAGRDSNARRRDTWLGMDAYLKEKTTEAFQFVYSESHHFAKTGSGYT